MDTAIINQYIIIVAFRMYEQVLPNKHRNSKHTLVKNHICSNIKQEMLNTAAAV